MSGAPTGWQAPRTNWTSDHPVQHHDLNRMEGNTLAAEEGNRTLDQALVAPANVGTLRQLLSWLAGRIRAITGAANWWEAPATTLAAANNHINSTTVPTHGSTPEATPSTLSHRDAAGRIRVADGVAAADAVTRGQLDGRAPLRLVINAQTASYTLVMADGDGRLITMDSASALTLTVPTNASVAFPIGTQILVQQLGAGQVTVAAASGVVLQSHNNALRARGQFAVLGLVKRLSDTWAVVGNVVV